MPAKPAVINQTEDLMFEYICNQNIKSSTSNVQIAIKSIKIRNLMINISVLEITIH